MPRRLLTMARNTLSCRERRWEGCRAMLPSAHCSTVGAASGQLQNCLAQPSTSCAPASCHTFLRVTDLESGHARCCGPRGIRQPVAPCASPAKLGLRPPHAHLLPHLKLLAAGCCTLDGCMGVTSLMRCARRQMVALLLCTVLALQIERSTSCTGCQIKADYRRLYGYQMTGNELVSN